MTRKHFALTSFLLMLVTYALLYMLFRLIRVSSGTERGIYFISFLGSIMIGVSAYLQTFSGILHLWWLRIYPVAVGIILGYYLKGWYGIVLAPAIIGIVRCIDMWIIQYRIKMSMWEMGFHKGRIEKHMNDFISPLTSQPKRFFINEFFTCSVYSFPWCLMGQLFKSL